MFYVMDSDPDDTGVMIMQRPVIPINENVALDLGTPLGLDIPLFDFLMDEECQGEVLDYVWTTFPGLVISAKFRSVIESVGIDNVEYYPVRIVNQVTGEVRSDYYAANIVGVVACMDKEKSQFTTLLALPDRIRSIEALHLDYQKIHQEKLFRLAELKTSIILAHETLKIVVENAKLRGVTFIPAEGYST